MPKFISGKLLGNDQVPAAFAQIELYGASGGSLGSVVDYATTDSQGNYQLRPVPGQTQGFLRLLPGPFNEQWWCPATTDLPAWWTCSGPKLITFVDVDPTGKLGTQTAQYSFISGRVADSISGVAISGVYVYLRAAGGGKVLRTTRTNAGGEFLFSNLACYPIDDEEHSLALSGFAVGYESGWYWSGAPTPLQTVNTKDHASISRGPVLQHGAIPLDRLTCCIPCKTTKRIRRRHFGLH